MRARSAAASADSASVTIWRAEMMEGSCLKSTLDPGEVLLERRRLKKPPLERVELEDWRDGSGYCSGESLRREKKPPDL